MRAARFVMRGLFDLGKPIKCRSGWLWELENEPSRILKVTQDPDPAFLKRFNKILSYLQRIDSPSVVKVHEFGVAKKNGARCQIPFHYHVMEKLNPLPKGSYVPHEMFTELLSYYYRSRQTIPFFLSDNMINFIKDLKKLKYKYCDLHYDNIMQNEVGKFKIIDLEAFLG